ncbi:MAG: hypothetical protein ACQEXX_32000 [Bacillota bacterium]
MKLDCINFEEKTITIKEVRVKYGKKVVVKKPKSESSQRILPLIEKIEDYLLLLRSSGRKTNCCTVKITSIVVLYVAGLMVVH